MVSTWFSDVFLSAVSTFKNPRLLRSKWNPSENSFSCIVRFVAPNSHFDLASSLCKLNLWLLHYFLFSVSLFGVESKLDEMVKSSGL